MGKQDGQAWLEQARRDLVAAQDNVATGHFEWACFQAQQAAEKALKGYLLMAGRSYQRVHAVGELLDECARLDPEFEAVRPSAELDVYYVTTRYPDAVRARALSRVQQGHGREMPIPRVIFDRVRDEIERELADWVPRIVAEMQPARVILFGSAARGEAGEDSDIDLCVIAETDLKFFDRMTKVIGLYGGRRTVEVLVYTPEEWWRMLDEGRDFASTIASEGRILYEA